MESKWVIQNDAQRNWTYLLDFSFIIIYERIVIYRWEICTQIFSSETKIEVKFNWDTTEKLIKGEGGK